MKKILSFLLIIVFYNNYILAQSIVNNFTQTIKGVVIDADSKNPLSAATINLQTANVQKLSSNDGSFFFDNVTVGKHTLIISYSGYEEKTISDITLTSGKELVLTVALAEKIKQKKLDEVVITSSKNKLKALNEFATASARSFSMEDAKRYPAAAFDPGRMAQNFAGVSNNGDANNQIIVRGNSPQGVLWRLEGVEISNPNHFGNQGSSGGAISMISSNVMGSSDFYTGAFPSEYGNANAGVFDINFRTGNKDKIEYTFMAGLLGIEAAAEGPFKKGKRSSFLVNYRYSTLQLLSKVIDLGPGFAPNYNDLSYKFNFPYGKKNNLSIYGIRGKNTTNRNAKKDSTLWKDETEPNYSGTGETVYNVIGLSNQSFINDKSYIKVGLTYNYDNTIISGDTLNQRKNYEPVKIQIDNNKDVNYRGSILYNNKLNSQHTLRAGVIVSNLSFNYLNSYLDTDLKKFKDFLKIKGSANYLQAYVQWKYKINNQFTALAGIHTSQFGLNNNKSFEPRFSLTYKAPKNQTLTFATGIHARLEKLSTYYVESVTQNTIRTTPNKNLEMQKALHYVLSYEKLLKKGFRFKSEIYYQYLYDVPVEQKVGSGFSILNASDFYEILNAGKLVNTGTGKNYGIDLSLEKSFSKGFYFIGNGSLFNSKYTNYDNKEFNTAFNRNYQINIITGREWKMDFKGNRIFGLSGKILTSGGIKQSEIDLPSSKSLRKTMYVADKFYTQSNSPYYRFDMGMSFKRNKKNKTRTLSIDLQNVTNRENSFNSYFDVRSGSIKKLNQLKLLPIINYRIEF